MRAAVFHGPGERLAVEERATPDPGKDGLVVKVAFCGICGSDIHAAERQVLPLDLGTILGHEFSGEVAQSNSQNWQPGDRVIGVPLRECDDCRPLGRCKDGLGILCPNNKVVGMSAAVPGAYAEYVSMREGQTIRIPDGVSLEAAALAEPLAVAAHATQIAGQMKDLRVLVIGAGPIGLGVLALSRIAGAGTILISEIDDARRERAARLGATHVIDPRAGPVHDSIASLGFGAPDLIFECVGARGLLQECINLSAIHGRIIVLGVNRTDDSFIPFSAMKKEVTIKYSLGYEYDDFKRVLDLMAGGQIDAEAMVSKVIGLDELPDMFERLRRPNPEAKVLIAPSR